jgi:hypothetical protein
MPTPRNIIPTVNFHVMLPIDLKLKLDLYLFSELENRVPKGAYQRFLVGLLREHFSNVKDLQ